LGFPVPAQAPLTGALADDALAYVDTLAQAASRALGDALAAVILHGSLTLGDYLPARSDIDLLLIVADPLTDAHVAGLAKAVGQQQPRAPFRVDLRVVTRTATGVPSPLPPMEAYLRIKGPERRVHIEGRHRCERDLAVEFSVCRAHGRSLLGATPSELIGRVPDRWVHDAGDAQLADWQAIGDDSPIRPADRAERMPSLAVRRETPALLKGRRGRLGAATGPQPPARTRRPPPAPQQPGTHDRPRAHK
jgi:Nucleotidyltransferase domain